MPQAHQLVVVPPDSLGAVLLCKYPSPSIRLVGFDKPTTFAIEYHDLLIGPINLPRLIAIGKVKDGTIESISCLPCIF